MEPIVSNCPKCNSSLLGTIPIEQLDIALICCNNRDCSWVGKYKITSRRNVHNIKEYMNAKEIETQES